MAAKKKKCALCNYSVRGKGREVGKIAGRSVIAHKKKGCNKR